MSSAVQDSKSADKKRKSKIQPTTDDRPAKKVKKGVVEKTSRKSDKTSGLLDSKRRRGADTTQEAVKIVNGHKDKRSRDGASPLEHRRHKSSRPETKEEVKGKRKKKHSSTSLDHSHASAENGSRIEVESRFALTSTSQPPYRIPESWQLSRPIGGKFCRLDPCFSADERHILLATRHSLLVYSISNSLLRHSILVHPKNSIVAFSISETNHDLAFVATSDGTVTLVDWQAGQELYSINYGCQIIAMVPVATEEFASDTLFMVIKSNVGSKLQSHVASVVFAHQGQLKSQPTLEQLSSTSDNLQHLQVFNRGRVVFAASRTTILLGWSPVRRGKEHLDQEETLKHMWKTVDFAEGLTCFHARCFSSPRQKEAVKQPSTRQDTFNLAIGSESGVIYLYDNILNIFREHESTLTKPKRLHWHRHAVGSVKWSLDGNYLISGGCETVLVIWQLETSRRQDLPHLVADIQSIKVSPSGTSYAVQLGDNSVLVLSTSELAPKATMSGIQSKCIEDDSAVPSWDIRQLLVPLVEHPASPDHVLLAVPASAGGGTRRHIPKATPFLQTFDIHQNRSVARQGLARNNVTNINIAPNQHILQEANVSKIAITSDGQWLATIEKWSPPQSDIKEGTGVVSADDTRQERNRRRETYLKIWSWDEDKSQWSLHTRIDAPHRSESEPECSRIIDLVQIPGQPAFATIGEDSVVRLWSPKTRLADGRIKRRVDTTGQTTWSCSSTISIERNNAQSDSLEDQGKLEPCHRASLAFSADGTVLAIAVDSPSGLVHFFDAKTGELQMKMAGMYRGDLVGIQILGRYLVIVANDVRVWDVTINQLVFNQAICQPQEQPKSQISLLAVDETSGRFAVSSTILLKGRLGTRVLVFDPKNGSSPVFAADEPGIITALATSRSTSSFILLNAEAELRILSSSSSGSISRSANGHPASQPRRENAIAATQNHDHESRNSGAAPPLLNTGDADDDSDNDADMQRSFVRGNQLAQLFEGMSSHALPPVQDMFYAVAKLYIGKNVGSTT